MKTNADNTSPQKYHTFSGGITALPRDRRFLKYTFGLGFLLALSFVLGSMLTNEHQIGRAHV